MSSYGGKDLFNSGPHTFRAHGLTQRVAEHDQPGADGAKLTALGRSTRVIEQSGTLIADSLSGLMDQTQAIEAAMDGTAADLVDHLGRTWAGVLMLSFEPGDVRRIGPRWATDYAVRYSQPQP